MILPVQPLVVFFLSMNMLMSNMIRSQQFGSLGTTAYLERFGPTSPFDPTLVRLEAEKEIERTGLPGSGLALFGLTCLFACFFCLLCLLSRPLLLLPFHILCLPFLLFGKGREAIATGRAGGGCPVAIASVTTVCWVS